MEILIGILCMFCVRHFLLPHVCGVHVWRTHTAQVCVCASLFPSLSRNRLLAPYANYSHMSAALRLRFKFAIESIILPNELLSACCCCNFNYVSIRETSLLQYASNSTQVCTGTSTIAHVGLDGTVQSTSTAMQKDRANVEIRLLITRYTASICRHRILCMLYMRVLFRRPMRFFLLSLLRIRSYIAFYCAFGWLFGFSVDSTKFHAHSRQPYTQEETKQMRDKK